MLGFQHFFLLSSWADISWWQISLYGHLLQAQCTSSLLCLANSMAFFCCFGGSHAKPWLEWTVSVFPLHSRQSKISCLLVGVLVLHQTSHYGCLCLYYYHIIINWCSQQTVPNISIYCCGDWFLAALSTLCQFREEHIPFPVNSSQ